MGNPMQRALFATLVIFAATGLSGCVTGGGSEPDQLTQGQTADYFLMEPTRLEKGHIFMRRTPAAGSQMAQESGQRDAQQSPGVDVETRRTQELLLMTEEGAGNQPMLPPHQWQDIKDAKVFVHTQNKPFQALIEDVVNELQPRVGPWRVQWKITRENRDVLNERFSLNTETTFSRFVSSVAMFMLNYRGLELNFELFEKERVLVISDVFPT